MGYRHTLCWDCANATDCGCDWSWQLKPVKGWEARKTEIGYIVIKCPEFERDSLSYGQIRLKPDDKRRGKH